MKKEEAKKDTVETQPEAGRRKFLKTAAAAAGNITVT